MYEHSFEPTEQQELWYEQYKEEGEAVRPTHATNRTKPEFDLDARIIAMRHLTHPQGIQEVKQLLRDFLEAVKPEGSTYRYKRESPQAADERDIVLDELEANARGYGL